MIKFDNTYLTLGPKFYKESKAHKFLKPELIIFNKELASELEISFDGVDEEELARIFCGEKILAGSKTYSQTYAGFQFGHPNPLLGDGRAMFLGETNGYDIQLKGSGQTPFSRRGDGFSALGPVLREYIVSEAMHSYGVPTTRALACVSTGEEVIRQFGNEPGGVFTRVSSSHIRVGTFQYFFFNEDYESMEKLLRYSVSKHYPELEEESNLSNLALNFIKAVAKSQAKLIAKWHALGFIHGVMNTDNFSIGGFTIDFGPCAFVDHFKKYKVYSSIDRQGRYAFWNQVPIGQWNTLRLADCLLYFIDSDKEKAIKMVEEEIVTSMELFATERSKALANKFGITDFKKEDEAITELFLDYLEEENLDFTLSFRNLDNLYDGDYHFFPNSIKLDKFIKLWKERVEIKPDLSLINPYYIPRNHDIEKVIDLAYEGDFKMFHDMNAILKNPYKKHESITGFDKPPTKEQIVYQTFCGT